MCGFEAFKGFLANLCTISAFTSQTGDTRPCDEGPPHPPNSLVVGESRRDPCPSLPMTASILECGGGKGICGRWASTAAFMQLINLTRPDHKG